ncbi:MAG: translocation and assembly module TamB [Myxococcales bacterium]|nr:translocation and assembly module TamB [Myxococcales bacterium]
MRRRALKALVHGAQVLGTSAVFVGALVGSVMIHANMATTRRMAQSVTNDALSTLFLGRLVLGDVEELTLGPWGHVRVAQAEIFDPEGRRVILAKGIDGRIDLKKLVTSLLSKGTPEISLDEARIDEAEVLVDIDKNGDIGIARALFPRPSRTPTPVTVKAPSAEDVRLSIPNARLRHAWVHGNVVPPKLDADADDVHARVFISENRLNVEVDEVHLTARAPRAPGQSSDVHGLATGGITVPLSAAARAVNAAQGGAAGSTTGGVTMHWDLDGDGAGIPLKAHLGLDGDVLDASADFPLAQPDVVRRAFPALPISKPVELHAKAHGKLPTLAVTAHGNVGGSTLDATGEVGLRDKQPFHLDADLGKVDSAAFGGPESDVSGHVHVEGVIASGAPTGTFTLSTKPSVVLAQRVPAVDAAGDFDRRTVSAKVHASEPGVEVDGKVIVSIPEETLAFDAVARSKDLHALARAPGMVSGSGTAHATGTIDLARATVAAHVVADASGVSRAPASAGSVHADATVEGPLANPVIDVTASAKEVRLTAASGDSKAEKKEPLTYPNATGHARIILSPTPKVLDAVVHVDGTQGGSSIDAKVSEVVFGPGGVAVRGGHVTGLGAPLDLEVQVQDGALSIRAKGEGLDMQRVAAMTGIRELTLLPEGSLATMDIDVKATPTRTDGHVDVTIAGAKDGTAAEVHATLSGRHVSGNARLAVGALGFIEVQRAELEMPGGLSVANAKRATGALDLRGDLDLSQGAALFANERIERISGNVALSARVERLDARVLPTVYASAMTRELDVTLNDNGTSTHIGGIDLGLHVGHDGASDETEISALAWDVKGILGSADTKAHVPLFGWATGTKPFDRDALTALEVSGVVDMQRREAGDLPGIFARPDLRGALSLHSTIAGSFAKPRVTLVARAEGLAEKQTATTRVQARYAPIDAVLEARWDGSNVVATVSADETEGERARSGPAAVKQHKAGHVRGLLIAKVPSADLFAGRPLAWNASGELDVADLELAPLPLPQNVRGTLTGRVKLRDLTGEPLLEANARVDGLGIAGVRVLRGDLRLVAKNGALDASARVNQEDGGNGRVDVVSSSLRWHGVDVAWDDAKSTKIDYMLDRVRLAVLRPFVRRSIPEIDGQVDGRGSATIDATSHVFEGGVGVSGGRLYVNAIGEEITDIRANAVFERDGAFRIQDATAKIGSGEIKASAAGRMRGVRFESIDLVAVVPTKEGVPLSAEGATFAAATGEVHLSARMPADKKAVAVTVTIPRAKVMVPARGTQTLQSMDPDKTIDIGIRRRDGTLVAATERPGSAQRTKAAAIAAAKAAAAIADGSAQPEDNLAARFTVTLGDDVELEGRGVRVFLTGRTVVDIADEIAMTGQIALKQGGTIDVQGRRFVVDRGTVTFAAGDAPTDPIIVAAAYWDAPDRTRIWVEFNGPLKTGKLTLRSEPPFSKNEILSILLFGRADPNQARAGDARPSDTQAATDVGTGLASSGLNQALGDLDEDFDLEQDHTSANRSRTKVGYRLRRNLKVQLGYASGFSQREPDTTFLFLEWQFVPKWSLIGTRGDKGTSILDVLFQHRY